MSLVIRRADSKDAGIVLDLIRGLATFEHLLDEVTGTEADLTATLFSSEPRAFCEIAEWNGDIAGFALWFYNYSTFLCRPGIYLEDLYVHPQYRSHGIGKAMLAFLARRCLNEKLGRLEWAVLDWNVPAIAFYRKQGATLRKEWIGCRLTGSELEALAAS
jgi:GNAT superfamily N-acetyltransferase